MDRPRPFAITPKPRRPVAAEPPRHLVACGVGLGDLRIWSESCWERTPAPLRPDLAKHCPDLGWVVVVPLSLGD
jgi:hypothetical protein